MARIGTVAQTATLFNDIIDPNDVLSLRDSIASKSAELTAMLGPDRLGVRGVAKRLAETQGVSVSTENMAAVTAAVGRTLVGVNAEQAQLLSRTTEMAALLSTFGKDFTRTSEMTAMSESLLVSAGMGRIGGVFDFARAISSLIGHDTSRLNRAFAGFSTSIARRPEWLASAPDFVRTAPAETVFTQARFVHVVTDDEDIEEQSAADEIWTGVRERTLGYVEAALPDVDSRLMTSWEGAWQTARRRGPDWARQSACSMRDVLMKVLNTIAPIDEVKKSHAVKAFIRDDRIRLAQVAWLCEPLENRRYAKVIRADLDSAMTIIDAMSALVHETDCEEIENAFDAMAVRAAVSLANLLRVWKAKS